MSSTDWKWVPLSKLLNSEKRKKSCGARSGEYRAYLGTDICLLAKNWWILWDHFGTLFLCSNLSHHFFVIFHSSTIILIYSHKKPNLFHIFISFCYQTARLFVIFHNLSWHKIHELLVFSSYTSWNKLNVSVEVLFNLTRNMTCEIFYQALSW